VEEDLTEVSRTTYLTLGEVIQAVRAADVLGLGVSLVNYDMPDPEYPGQDATVTAWDLVITRTPPVRAEAEE
jgi:hypothetical protein